jgi:hypothetical protein
MIRRIRQRSFGLLIWLLILGCVLNAQQGSEVQRLAEMRRIYTQLKTASECDVVMVLSEPAINQALQSLTGLEITLANGALLRVNSFAAKLRANAAEVLIGVQAQASAEKRALNLRLTGILNNAERKDDALQLPFRLTDVTLGNGLLTPLLRLWFGEWLAPERWNAALPALTLPRELTESVEIPAKQFEVTGALPMTVTTSAYQLPLKFELAAVCVLEGRLVIALRLAGTEAPAVMSTTRATADEIARLSEQLNVERDLRARVSQRMIGYLLAQLASARNNDINMRLHPARVRQEEVEGFLRVTNYTDLEGGEAQGDLRQIAVDRIDGERIETRLNVQGVFDARLRGREYGIPYRLTPRGAFAINDRRMPLRVTSENGRALLQAEPGTMLPLELQLKFGLAGREISFYRQVNLPAERLLSPLELPAFYLRKLPLPRKLTVDKSGQLSVMERRELSLHLSGLQIRAQAAAVEINGNVAFKTQ